MADSKKQHLYDRCNRRAATSVSASAAKLLATKRLVWKDRVCQGARSQERQQEAARRHQGNPQRLTYRGVRRAERPSPAQDAFSDHPSFGRGRFPDEQGLNAVRRSAGRSMYKLVSPGDRARYGRERSRDPAMSLRIAVAATAASPIAWLI